MKDFKNLPEILHSQMLKAEWSSMISRIVFICLLIASFFFMTEQLALNSTETIWILAIAAALAIYTIVEALLLRRKSPPRLLVWASVLIDCIAATAALLLILVLSDPLLKNVVLIYCMAYYLFIILSSILRLQPANSVVAGAISSVGALCVALLIEFRIPQQGGSLYLYYLPVFNLFSGLMAGAIGRSLRRSLEDNMLTERFERLSSRLRGVLGGGGSAVSNLWDLVGDLESICKRLQDGLTKQTNGIEHISGSVAGLKDSMEGISKSSDVSEKTIKQAVDFSASGNSTVQQVVQEILGIQELADQMTTALELINGVADQTNLLALNAAIEASHVGDESAGFSVVADEVRALAAKTSATADEISKLIRKTELVILSAGESSKKAGAIFGEITKDLGIYFDFVRKQHHALQEQMQANSEFVAAIGSVSQTVRENTASLASITRGFAELQTELTKLADVLGQQPHDPRR